MRRPIHEERVGGAGPRQRLWDRIRRLDGDFSLKEIVMGGENDHTARDYILSLEKAGYVQVTTPATRKTAKRYTLVKDNGIEAPRVRRDGSPVTLGLPQEQMWRTLNLLKTQPLNARELAAHASTPDIPVSDTAAADYLINLNRAGYLRCVKPSKNVPGGQARYVLTAFTGPKPPMVQRIDALYDPNLGEVIWLRPINEETAIYGH